MQEITETKTIYISKDGKKFTSKKSCEYHEIELDKEAYKKKINEMTLEELNNEIIKFIGEKGKHYTTNINDAFELEQERNLFYAYDYKLYRDSDEWIIGHQEYDSIYDDICCNTIPEAISRIAILKFHELI